MQYGYLENIFDRFTVAKECVCIKTYRKRGKNYFDLGYLYIQSNITYNFLIQNNFWTCQITNDVTHLWKIIIKAWGREASTQEKQPPCGKGPVRTEGGHNTTFVRGRRRRPSYNMYTQYMVCGRKYRVAGAWYTSLWGTDPRWAGKSVTLLCTVARWKPPSHFVMSEQ